MCLEDSPTEEKIQKRFQNETLLREGSERKKRCVEEEFEEKGEGDGNVSQENRRGQETVNVAVCVGSWWSSKPFLLHFPPLRHLRSNTTVCGVVSGNNVCFTNINKMTEFSTRFRLEEDQKEGFTCY